MYDVIFQKIEKNKNILTTDDDTVLEAWWQFNKT
jgi:hypothetical protein